MSDEDEQLAIGSEEMENHQNHPDENHDGEFQED